MMGNAQEPGRDAIRNARQQTGLLLPLLPQIDAVVRKICSLISGLVARMREMSASFDVGRGPSLNLSTAAPSMWAPNGTNHARIRLLLLPVLTAQCVARCFPRRQAAQSGTTSRRACVVVVGYFPLSHHGKPEQSVRTGRTEGGEGGPLRAQAATSGGSV